MKKSRSLLSKIAYIMISASFLACSTGVLEKVSGKSSKKTPVPEAANIEVAKDKAAPSGNKEIQLKGAFLLSQSIGATFGQGKDLITKAPVNRRDSEKKLSCFEEYASNFGAEDGLRFGEMYADSPSSSYFMALSICATKVAAACLADSAVASSNCYCGSKEAATAMLRRAIPSIDVSKPETIVIIDKFHTSCQASYPKAIAALVNSLGFVSRR